jgi:glycosyltransferase involved in cell wall biosynthesis
MHWQPAHLGCSGVNGAGIPERRFSWRAVFVDVLVSVCIPTHDRTALLQKALLSLCRMEPSPGISWEVIVVANCCRDATAQTVLEMAPQMPFPLLLVEESSPGVVAARNRAVRAARGEIIAFLDDDITIGPRWLHELVACFIQIHPDVLVGRIYLDWHGMNVPGWFDRSMAQYLAEVNLGDRPMLLQNPLGAGANMAITRVMLDQVGEFRCPLSRCGQRTAGEDTDLIGRAMMKGAKVLYAPSVTVAHYVAPQRLNIRYLCGVAYDVGMAEYLMPVSVPQSELRSNLLKKILRLTTRFLRWAVAAPFHRRSGARLRVNMAKVRGNIRGIMHRMRRQGKPDGVQATRIMNHPAGMGSVDLAVQSKR